jgi:hypothetical protein
VHRQQYRNGRKRLGSKRLAAEELIDVCTDAGDQTAADDEPGAVFG